ncbi:hypothetical protein GCM10010388_09190 [Streptomyces mauvecolor]
MTLAHWQVPQAPLGLLRLSDVAKACTGGEHPVEDRPRHSGASSVRLRQKGSDTMSELKAALLPPCKQRGITHQSR